MLPPRQARADQAADLAPFSDGVGGPSTLALPAPAPDSTDALATVDLATGGLRSAFAFELPPARGNAQPSLSLLYNSSANVGSAGLGWTLDLPSITRRGTAGVPTVRGRRHFITRIDVDRLHL
jgi:hypothetical protein